MTRRVPAEVWLSGECKVGTACNGHRQAEVCRYPAGQFSVRGAPFLTFNKKLVEGRNFGAICWQAEVLEVSNGYGFDAYRGLSGQLTRCSAGTRLA
ncbi:hypothetical protein NPIL_522661 [Nephila pilipes]|uniref:Uncharacterized protein n=1 Tax=Nephila pilipes TaxID=299642 RepID=A0A8X6UQY6_NEPPI|nr:hypothetical protein NPIL_522661 [Nephila pilipes]